MSNWRTNVELLGLSDPSWWPWHGGPLIRVNIDLAAELDPPVVFAGHTYTYVVSGKSSGGFRVWNIVRLLPGEAWVTPVPWVFTTDHFPFGFLVVPD